MQAVSLDAFSEEGFDAAAWVNGALAAKPAEEPLDMHVGELLMRMQLLAQDVQYNLRDSSDLAMMNLPKSQREMELIQAEAGALHTQTERLKKELEDTMRTSDGSRIAHLGELDVIKLKAEGCVEKLNEAEKLDNLRLQVENAFRSDDLSQMAQSLGAFRASLVRSLYRHPACGPAPRRTSSADPNRCAQAVVGELRQGKLYGKQLEQWTEGVEAKVVPLLKQSIDSADGGVAKFREVLENIGRGAVAGEVYRTSVHERMDTAWQSFTAAQDSSTGAALSAWVESFFAGVVGNARRDIGWCGELLPSPSSSVRGAVAEALSTLSPSFAERISECLTPLDAKESTETFCTLHAVALQFAEDLESTCQPAAAAAEYLDDSELAALFRNFVSLQKDYTKREAQRFGRECIDAAEGLRAIGEASADNRKDASSSLDALQPLLVPVSEFPVGVSLQSLCIGMCALTGMHQLFRIDQNVL